MKSRRISKCSWVYTFKSGKVLQVHWCIVGGMVAVWIAMLVFLPWY